MSRKRLWQKTYHRIIRRSKAFVRAQPGATICALVLVMASSFWVYKQSQPLTVAAGAYAPLLNVIARGESHGNYNAYYGHGGNTRLRFTERTIAEVLKWQDDYVRKGSPSNAVGKYQIVRPTLLGLVRQLKLDPQTRYNEATQDHLAIALLERRGAVAYVKQDLSDTQFAANLAKEWASLPRASGARFEESYYAGDGLNRSRISTTEIFTALHQFKNLAEAQ